ncbi:helix-turn-helix domain-containing protein [Chitinophaga sedimenti]|uniref:helix-turn-helix domain-containing protein n=1 Tax=Chitinophaga sedimenti TaxID=2033606 RepID=UPI00200559A0|nr:helix-turn-helix transcriptional regulator [Chitinophaga sedimenti]MCK7557089.1 helix-turn-helix domain-containing protein [Chitinophaga sedimenti]
MLGDKLKKIREFRDVSREYMAEKLSMSVSAYGNIERGMVRNIPVPRLLAILALLDCPPGDFFKADDVPSVLAKTDPPVYGIAELVPLLQKNFQLTNEVLTMHKFLLKKTYSQ